MKNLKSILTATLLLCCTKGIYAQTLSLPLWENNPPPYTLSVLEQDQLEGTSIVKVAIPQLLVYLPEKAVANGAAILICPGGGYSKLAIAHEGHQVAEWYQQKGYVAAILKYRLPDEELVDEAWKVPLSDAEQGIRLIRQKAGEWQLDQQKVGVLGFSAGGHLGSSLSVHGKAAEKDTPASRPDFSILIYPVISMDTSITHAGSRNNLLGEKLQTEWEQYYSTERQVNAQTPPAFLVHSWDDKGVPVQNSIRYAEALQQHQVPLELHLFQKGGHGYGLGKRENTGNAPAWPELSHVWIQEILESL
jgi:acetyl esterase/lipase